MTKKLFKLTREKSVGAELKQITSSSNDTRALDLYCLKAGKTQEQEGWIEDVWFCGVVIHYLHE